MTGDDVVMDRAGEGSGRTARKRRAILEAATEIFLKDGYLGAGMDEIASLADVSKQTIYKQFAATLAKGDPLPNITFGGYAEDMVQNTPFGAGADEKTIKVTNDAIAALKAKAPIFKGPIKDNKGNVVLPDATYDNMAPVLNGMTYLVDGVIGSTT